MERNEGGEGRKRKKEKEKGLNRNLRSEVHIVVTSCVLRIIKLTRWLCPSTSQLYFREVPMSSKSDGVGVGLFQTCSVKSPPLHMCQGQIF